MGRKKSKKTLHDKSKLREKLGHQRQAESESGDFFDDKQEVVDPLFEEALKKLSDQESHSKLFLDIADKKALPKKSKMYRRNEVVIDLHGKNLFDALDLIDRIFNQAPPHQEINYKIVTGRGIHSPFSGVLVNEVYQHVLQRYRLRIREISEDPSQLKIDGLPIKGYFTVRIK